MNQLPILDLSIVLFSLIALIVAAYFLGRNQQSVQSYFLSNKDLPWWAICGSIVATETSTLSFIGFPAISFFGNLNFVQLLLGYVVGRIIISVIFLPDYFNGKLKTSYQFLEQSFGEQSRKTTSILFLITRLLGDGVRLFATAIPLKLLTGWSYEVSILLIIIITIIFSYMGGIKAIVWTDFSQLIIYMLGASIAAYFIVESLSDGLSTLATIDSSKFDVLNWSFSFSDPYTFYWAILGGILLTLSSHGTDHLLVQRILTAKSLTDGKKALITSGFVVFLQALFFMFIGLLLLVFYSESGVEFATSQRNEILPYFIVNELPVGLKGIVIASIFAAAISTLSSSLSSMASSTVYDVKKEENNINLAKLLMIVWGICQAIVAYISQFTQENVVVLGLSIASILYGGILGVFLTAKFKWQLDESKLLICLFSGIIPIFILWLYQVISGNSLIAWTLFIPIGSGITLALARLFRH